jgi:AcrR family transcriptional regulator
VVGVRADDEAPVGLRERKKQETRDALSWAAIRLGVERGWDNVTVADVAAAANVSERTFRNYFANKAEAVAARHLDRMMRVADELRGRPVDEPLWEAITSAVTSQFAGGQPQNKHWTEAVRLILNEPDVERGFVRATETAQREFAAVVAERTGTDVARELYPTLVAAAVSAAITSSMEHWLRADPPVAIEGLIREAFDRLRAGLPVP